MTESETIAIKHLIDHPGVGTWLVALDVGLPTPATRRLLIRLEHKGLVVRVAGRSSCNNVAWAATEEGRSGVEAGIRARIAGCARCLGSGVVTETVARGLRYISTPNACTVCGPDRATLRAIQRAAAHG